MGDMEESTYGKPFMGMTVEELLKFLMEAKKQESKKRPNMVWSEGGENGTEEVLVRDAGKVRTAAMTGGTWNMTGADRALVRIDRTRKAVTVTTERGTVFSLASIDGEIQVQDSAPIPIHLTAGLKVWAAAIREALHEAILNGEAKSFAGSNLEKEMIAFMMKRLGLEE